MIAADLAQAVLEQLRQAGFPEAEVYHKQGRSRTLRLAPGIETTAFGQEEGWAVRAGDRRRSFFFAAAGKPRPDTAWPAADGQGLRLPSAKVVPRWTPPSDLEAPLIGESEARNLITGLRRALDTEAPGARLATVTLEDGASESLLLSSRGVVAAVRQRAAALHLHATGSQGQSATLLVAERAGNRFHPQALARRLADRLLVSGKDVSTLRDRGETLLSPVITIRLLTALSQLFLGPAAKQWVPALERNGRIGGPALTLIDNGRLAGGMFEAAVDGEGMPCREVVLVEGGIFRQPLLTWAEESASVGRASGCARRSSWRDLPQLGATHLFLQPDPSRSVLSLVEEIQRGYYLLDTEGPPRIDLELNRFAVPVCGLAIAAGRASGSLSGVWLTGSVASFFSGILALGRDLTFLPALGGVVGAPTLLVRGLELRRP